MSIVWKSPFYLEIPGTSVADLRALVDQRRRRFLGLRGVRIRGNILRARYVIDLPAMSAPLLKAKASDTEQGCQLDGVVTWGAVYYGGLLPAGGLVVVGLMGMGFATTQHAWQPLALGILTLALGYILARCAFRSFATERMAYMNGFEQDLRAVFKNG